MTVWIQRYAALLRAAWLVDLQYRATIAIWFLWGIAEPTVALGIWWSIAGSGAVGGYDQTDFARYFFAVTLIGQLTAAWDAWYIDSWIREGEMNFRIARPISPVHEAIADNIAYKARAAIFVVAAWVLIAALWPAARLPFAPGRWALAAAAVALAAWIRFFNGYAIGLLAFWTTRATALTELQFGVALFLSGRIAPLTLLPAGVQRVAHWLWFPSMLAFPANVLTGTARSANVLASGFAAQILWCVVWWGAYRLVWWRGIRRYGAVGG